MRKTKGFTYDTIKDKDIVEHINKQPHQANYIWNLVRQDMSKDSDIENLVRKYVNEILKEKDIHKAKPTDKPIAKMIDVQQLLNIN